MGEMQEALELLEFSENRLGHIAAELIRLNDEGLDFEEYKEGLYAVFTEEKVQKAMRILDAEEFFIDVTLHNDYYNMLSLYDKLEVKKREMGR